MIMSENNNNIAMTITSNEAIRHLKNGEVIAYPTEAVFGLGCDPRNHFALEKILKLKERQSNKGLILIASDVQQISFFTDLSSVSKDIQDKINASWPGFVTWLLPINKANLSQIDPIIYGQYNTIAVRVSSHPTVVELCRLFNHSIISTSANVSGGSEIKDRQLMQQFILQDQSNSIAGIVEGELGSDTKPSSIIDALSGKQIR